MPKITKRVVDALRGNPPGRTRPEYASESAYRSAAEFHRFGHLRKSLGSGVGAEHRDRSFGAFSAGARLDQSGPGPATHSELLGLCTQRSDSGRNRCRCPSTLPFCEPNCGTSTRQTCPELCRLTCALVRRP